MQTHNSTVDSTAGGYIVLFMSVCVYPHVGNIFQQLLVGE